MFQSQFMRTLWWDFFFPPSPDCMGLWLAQYKFTDLARFLTIEVD